MLFNRQQLSIDPRFHSIFFRNGKKGGGGGVPNAKFAILSILASTLNVFFDILLYHCFKWIQQNNNQIVELYKINLLKIHVRVVLYLHVHVCLCFVYICDHVQLSVTWIPALSSTLHYTADVMYWLTCR